MNRTLLISSAIGVPIVIILILVVALSSGRKDKQPDPKTDRERDSNAANRESQNALPKDVLGDQGNSDSPNSGNRQAKLDPGRSPKVKLGATLDRVLPGYRHRYHLQLSAESPDGEKREWQGDFTIRVESQLSKLSAIRKKINQGLRPAKEHPLVSRQFGTGLRIPRRWVLVGYQFVEGASNVDVIVDGQRVKAEVRSRLKKTGFSVLRLDDASFPKVPIPKDDSMRKGTNLAFLDARGSVEIIRNIRSTSFTGSRGGQYGFEQKVPDNSVGGIAFDDLGNVTGLIVEAFHPTTQIGSYCRVHPISRIAKTWNEKNQKIIFGSPRTKTPENFESHLKQMLVQVVVERPTDPDSPFVVYMDSKIQATNLAAGQKVGSHKPGYSLKQISKSLIAPGIRASQNQLRQPPQLPFYLGSLVDQILFASTDSEESYPVIISSNGYLFSNAEQANGELKIEEWEIANEGRSIRGNRTLELKSNPAAKISSGKDSVDAVHLVANHSFELSEHDYLPIRSEIDGEVEIETEQGIKQFKLFLKITKMTETN